MNIPATVDECLVFEDWCEEQGLHPLEVARPDPEDLWSFTVSRFGYSNGDGFGDYGNGGGNANVYGWGSGSKWTAQ